MQHIPCLTRKTLDYLERIFLGLAHTVPKLNASRNNCPRFNRLFAHEVPYNLQTNGKGHRLRLQQKFLHVL